MATNEAGKQSFIKQWYDTAKSVADKLSVPVEAILGQWALETDWGNKVTKGTGYNIGNIKAGSNWAGAKVKAYDSRENSNDYYRVYNTPEQFANDYVNLIGLTRFKNAIGSKSPVEYFSKLQSGKLKYATDVNYVQSATATANSVKKSMINMAQDETGDKTGIRKWFMAMPSSGLIGAGLASIGSIANHEDGVIAGTEQIINNTLPDFGGIVDSAGNFVLRSVVIISAIALIVLGFYFMFKQEITNTVKAVTN